MAVLKSLAWLEKRLVNVRVSDSQLSVLRQLAETYTHGNLSEWVRYASLNFKPSEEDLVSEDHSQRGKND